MLTLIGFIAIGCVWIVATVLSLSVSDGTQATKDAVEGFKSIKDVMNSTTAE